MQVAASGSVSGACFGQWESRSTAYRDELFSIIAEVAAATPVGLSSGEPLHLPGYELQLRNSQTEAFLFVANASSAAAGAFSSHTPLQAHHADAPQPALPAAPLGECVANILRAATDFDGAAWLSHAVVVSRSPASLRGILLRVGPAANGRGQFVLALISTHAIPSRVLMTEMHFASGASLLATRLDARIVARNDAFLSLGARASAAQLVLDLLVDSNDVWQQILALPAEAVVAWVQLDDGPLTACRWSAAARDDLLLISVNLVGAVERRRIRRTQSVRSLSRFSSTGALLDLDPLALPSPAAAPTVPHAALAHAHTARLARVRVRNRALGGDTDDDDSSRSSSSSSSSSSDSHSSDTSRFQRSAASTSSSSVCVSAATPPDVTPPPALRVRADETFVRVIAVQDHVINLGRSRMLSFRRDEAFTVLASSMNGDEWFGFHKGKKGTFPKTHVQIIATE
jgi:hypothetical protein